MGKFALKNVFLKKFLFPFFQTTQENPPSLSDVKNIKDDPNTRKETKASGSVNFGTYKTFLQAAHSPFLVVIVCILFIAAQITWSGLDFFLSIWYICLSFLFIMY